MSMSTARKLIIQTQGLGRRWKLPKGKEGVAQVIERLGYVQIDTISVVQRAHHHTLWSRRSDYTPQMLHKLQAQDRRVFEWWTHAASYIPMCDYRYYRQRMRANAESSKTQKWLEQNARLRDNVVERLRNEGPLGSSDFSHPEGKRGSWWDWKPAKQALEMLFSMGEVMVTERRKFQRIYDLTERVLPEGIDTTEPDENEMARFMIRRALSHHGLATIDVIRGGRSSEAIQEMVKEKVDSGEVTPVDIKGLDGETQYALTKNIEEAAKRIRRQIHILSPFDNLVIHRGYLKRFFDFDFKLECYLPAVKRRYGYFCLPILWGDQFVGRLDSKADRKRRTFIIRNIIFEPGFRKYDDLLPKLSEKLHNFAVFNDCEKIEIERTKPESVRVPLERELSGSDN